jgi:hypothetical protein
MLFSQLPTQKFWGLLEYKPQWTLTLQGWLCLFLLLIAVVIGFAISILPFLRVSHPLETEIMVVEGWIPYKAMEGAIAEFQNNNYGLMITTGNNIRRRTYLSEYKTFANLAAATMISLGLDPQKVVAVSNETVDVNRTAASAKSVQQWFLNSDLKVKTINIYSYDVHTRRSWLVFKRILEPEIKVGAIAFPSPDYDPRSWWKTSEGAKSVIWETIAYIYAKFIWQSHH